MDRSSRIYRLFHPKWAQPLVIEPTKEVDVDSKSKYNLPWTALFLVALALLGFATSLVEYLRWTAPTTLASLVIWSVAIIALLALQPRTCSLVLIALYLAATVCEIITALRLQDGFGSKMAWYIVSIALSFISLVTVLNMPLRHPNRPRDGISRPFTVPNQDHRSPEDNLTMWQWMSVSWMAPLIALGSKRQLNDDDVWQLSYEFQHAQLHEAFRNLSGGVVRRLLKATWLDLLVLTLLALVELTANYASPIILQKLLQSFQKLDLEKKPAVSWAALILLAELVAAQCAVFGVWFGRRAYERSRGAMITMLHEKVLHRKILGGNPRDGADKEANEDLTEAQTEQGDSTSSSANDEDERSSEEQGLIKGRGATNQAPRSRIRSLCDRVKSLLPYGQKKSIPAEKEPASMGKILNLMRNDVYETAQRFWEFQTLINVPVGLVVSLVLVWRLIGWSSLLGIAVVVGVQIINALLARIVLSWEKTRRKATDHKLQQITQYVETIRHMRWYGWHAKKLQSVLDARQKELNLRIVTTIWTNLIIFLNVFSYGFLPVAIFWGFTALAGQKLSVDIAFPAIQLFTLLQNNLREVPNLITVFLNAAVAVGRIEEFMNEPDVATEGTLDFADHFELKEASFAWPGNSKTVLDELNISFPKGLTVVMGPVASGKSALLQALLGELDLRKGNLIRPDAPIGYCAQTPWLESMTIRDNILFFSPYDEIRYNRVLEACALLPDLATFQQGDLSPIGENGIGLSGGQKARVALARAVYGSAKILLLDDPLSALDQQTAEWIVARCLLGGLVKDRIVVLVTHRIDLCQHVSEQIIEMSEGRARAYKDTVAISTHSSHPAKTDSPSEQAKQTQGSAETRDKFEDEEHRAHGDVSLNVYWEYVKAGKLKWWALILVGTIYFRLSDYINNWFLKEWSEAYKSTRSILLYALQKTEIHLMWANPLSRFLKEFPDPAVNPRPWLNVYALIAILQALSVLFLQVAMAIVIYTAGKGLFIQIMRKISSATFRFYDVTPVGRLMNRLTSDVGTIDGPISIHFQNSIWGFVAWAISIIVIASITPLFLIFSIALAAIFVYVFAQFLPTSQSLRRLEMVSLSPLMSNFGALLNGLVTVRAFHAQLQFQERVVKVTDAFQKMDHFYWSLQAWLQYRFDWLSAVSTFILTLLAIFSGLSSGLTAFVLIAAQIFVKNTHFICKLYGQLQLDFVSVERVVELLHVDQEDPGSVAPPAYWPSLSSNRPAVEFEDVTVRYAPHLEPALRNVTFSIPSGSSTAIIGRTGSGKSTMALALLATIKPDSGRILVDGIDINLVSKQDLRSRVTFLAQEPVLFQGTLRTNLDPLSEYSGDECASVIRRIHCDTKYQWSTDTEVEAGGKNLSQGQRQLVGLARAILRRSAIIIMDEATASVDLETSWEVQRILKEELAGSTVITIAHRASAVRDCDMVVKLDKGTLAAYGTPGEVEVDADQKLGESA